MTTNDDVGPMLGDSGPGMLAGLRVIEVADERAEYTGLLLAGLGAEVIKIEPPEGNATRRIGPFSMTSRGSNARCFSGTTTATRNRSCSTCRAMLDASTCFVSSAAPTSSWMRAAAR